MPPKTEETFTKAMMLICLFILFIHFGETTGYGIRPDKNTTMLMEDTNITLSCLYEGSIDSLHWYQEKPGSRPEFLIMIDESSGYVTEANPPYPRLAIKRDKVQKRVSLEISSAAVTDSAMYYCALRPTVTGNTRTLYKNPYFFEVSVSVRFPSCTTLVFRWDLQHGRSISWMNENNKSTTISTTTSSNIHTLESPATSSLYLTAATTSAPKYPTFWRETKAYTPSLSEKNTEVFTNHKVCI